VIVRDGEVVSMNYRDANPNSGSRRGVLISFPSDPSRGSRYDAVDIDPRFLGISPTTLMTRQRTKRSLSPLGPDYPKHRVMLSPEGAIEFETVNRAIVRVHFKNGQVVQMRTMSQEDPDTGTTVTSEYRDWSGVVFPRRVERVWRNRNNVDTEVVEVESFSVGKPVDVKEVNLASLGIERGRTIYVHGSGNDSLERYWDGEKIVEGSLSQLPNPQVGAMTPARRSEMDWSSWISAAAVLVGLCLVIIGCGRRFLRRSPAGGAC
jgi:hypothetical protein